jgi:nitrate reductase assembly molybdenum cofactor insertion protein NarJ
MKNSTSSDEALREACVLSALAEGWSYPGPAWKARYEAARRSADRFGTVLPAPAEPEDLRSSYHAWFGHAPACPLELAFHLSSNPFEQAKTMAQIQGFYRAFGVETIEGERPDGLAMLLSFASYMTVKRRHAALQGLSEAAEVTSKALRDFAGEFLIPGLAAFGVKARELGLGGFYKDLLVAAERAAACAFGAPTAAASRWTPPAGEETEGEMKCGVLPR